MFAYQQVFPLPALVKLGKHRDFPSQDIGLQRLDQVIDRTQLISFAHSRVASVACRYENDGGIAKSLLLTDEPGRLEPIESGHLDVQQNDGWLIIEEEIQCGLCTNGFVKTYLQCLQH